MERVEFIRSYLNEEVKTASSGFLKELGKLLKKMKKYRRRGELKSKIKTYRIQPTREGFYTRISFEFEFNNEDSKPQKVLSKFIGKHKKELVNPTGFSIASFKDARKDLYSGFGLSIDCDTKKECKDFVNKLKKIAKGL